ncbi:MAG: nucleoside triphosphate pyrophosphohydrolase, partial [Candidatus Eiseniibacteriota bacterium]
MTAELTRLLDIMARLRDPARGCPWDVEQNFATIAPYTIEEAYEVADAIARADMAALKDELGDLLLQVVFHAQMAREAGQFDFADVAEAIADKMVRRHPHVFGEERVADSAAQTVAWEDRKAAERAEADASGGGALDGIALALPALLRAAKLGKRAARVGFDWPEAAPVLDKIEEEIGELRAELAGTTRPDGIEQELGDLLFACANLARKLDIDPEAALRGANGRFERRFRAIEARLGARGLAPKQVTL